MTSANAPKSSTRASSLVSNALASPEVVEHRGTRDPRHPMTETGVSIGPQLTEIYVTWENSTGTHDTIIIYYFMEFNMDIFTLMEVYQFWGKSPVDASPADVGKASPSVI